MNNRTRRKARKNTGSGIETKQKMMSSVSKQRKITHDDDESKSDSDCDFEGTERKAMNNRTKRKATENTGTGIEIKQKMMTSVSKKRKVAHDDVESKSELAGRENDDSESDYIGKSGY